MPDPRYEKFVERFFACGTKEVPADWPEALREDCLFFLRMVEAEPAVDPGRTQAAPEPAPAPPAREESRYVVERELGRGGMGRVLLALDGALRRKVAMKVLLDDGGAASASRFVEEAQATAQLEHPNIEPVYDLDVGPDGRTFFTMKWVQGRNLEEVLSDAKDAPTLVRLIQILQQAAMGVDFAHSRGVIHRDLKPQNIMVGDYGEVLVVDWGLAKVLGGKETGAGASITTRRTESGILTLDGSVQGSLPYMSPEQAQGKASRIDARTDVFGLGAILYRILAGSPPYTGGSPEELLEKARRGEIDPPRRRAPQREIPAELERICCRALSASPAKRFPTARAFHEALQGYLEGIHDAERRALEAGKLLRKADLLRSRLKAQERSVASFEKREKRLRSRIREHAPKEKKAPLWRLLERLGEARKRASATFGDATAAYNAVLSIDPGNSRARAALAGLFGERLHDAESRGDTTASKLYEGLVVQYGDARRIQSLRAQVPVAFRTRPAGAAVLLSRYEERGLLLVETPPETAGTTPFQIALPPGSYVATLRKAGYEDVRYPFLVERASPQAATVRLHVAGSIPEGFIQIPGGESIVGGDPQQLSSLERARVKVGEIFVRRFPITLGEYCELLDDLLGARRRSRTRKLDLAGELVPAFAEDYALRGPDGRWRPLARLGPKRAVTALRPSAMLEFCRWYSKRLGKPVRLLTEVEWERCARGADGRLFPWGNHFDWALCNGAQSRPGEPSLEPVGSFPTDSSPFGVRDLAGGVRDLCAGSVGEGYCPCRGGSWYNPFPFVFRADVRTMLKDGTRTTDIGFRLCYSGG